jgi:hypothetical protein
MTEAKIANAEHARIFMLAGNSRFTLKSLKSGQRFTYRIAVSDNDPKFFFVSVLTGPDNMGDYTYLGTIRRDSYSHGSKSPIGKDAPSAMAFAWFWDVFRQGRIPTTIELWHEGRCGRCSRVLTDPVSIKSGFGPECITKVPELSVGNL